MKPAKIIIVGVTLLAVGYLGFSSFNKIKKNRQIAENIQSLPVFSFERQLSGQFSNTNIDANAERLIINFFNPECEHCQYMASQIAKNKEQFSVHQLLLVTTADSLAVDKFNKTYRLSELPNVVLLRDTHYQFTPVFGSHIIPSFFVYDNDRSLVKKITGETKIENLLK
jgi:thiol-disulfide isomerase/thioredoxin